MQEQPVDQFNTKMLSYQYSNSHYKDETVIRPSYLYNGNFHMGKTTSLYWISLKTAFILIGMSCLINTLRLRRNRQHLQMTFSNAFFFNDCVWISLTISLKFVPRVPINNIPALVQIMAWCRPGDKPLSEPKMVSLPMHICVTQPQWVNTLRSE